MRGCGGIIIVKNLEENNNGKTCDLVEFEG